MRDDGDRLVPWEIESALYVERRRFREESDLPETKRVLFRAWEEFDGWLIPRELRFENGFSSFTLRVESLEFSRRWTKRRFGRIEALAGVAPRSSG